MIPSGRKVRDPNNIWVIKLKSSPSYPLYQISYFGHVSGLTAANKAKQLLVAAKKDYHNIMASTKHFGKNIYIYILFQRTSCHHISIFRGTITRAVVVVAPTTRFWVKER
jgi:hypothetical protein